MAYMCNPLSSVFHDLLNKTNTEAEQKIVYPIELPALEDCKTFLDAIQIFDRDPRIQSWIQFVDCVGSYFFDYDDNYICEQPELVAKALKGAVQRRLEICPYGANRIPMDLFSWRVGLGRYPFIVEALFGPNDRERWSDVDCIFTLAEVTVSTILSPQRKDVWLQ